MSRGWRRGKGEVPALSLRHPPLLPALRRDAGARWRRGVALDVTRYPEARCSRRCRRRSRHVKQRDRLPQSRRSDGAHGLAGVLRAGAGHGQRRGRQRHHPGPEEHAGSV